MKGNSPSFGKLAPIWLISLLAGVLPANAQLDFGDAPAPYPTTLAQNGARHLGNTHVFLGSKWDAENNGQPDPAALGDDNANRDDEDGVIIPSSLTIGSTINMVVLATNSPGGVLNAWVDFNRDGDWSDAGEQIFTNAACPTTRSTTSRPGLGRGNTRRRPSTSSTSSRPRCWPLSSPRRKWTTR